MLGLHTVEVICEGWSGTTLAEFCQHLEHVYRQAASVVPAAHG